MLSSLRILHLIAIGAALSCASRAFAESININFGSSTITGAAGYPGPAGQTGWNNLAGASGTNGTPINDSASSPTSTTVSYNAFQTGSWSPTPSGTNNAILLGSYLDGVPGFDSTQVVVGSIPSSVNGTAGYDVAVYVAGATLGSSTALSEYTLDGITKGVVTGPLYSGGTALTAADGNTEGNYILFSGLHGSSFTLTANMDTNAPDGHQYVNSPIDGISIISLGSSDGGGGGGSTPEPGSIILLGIGAVSLAAMRIARRGARLS